MNTNNLINLIPSLPGSFGAAALAWGALIALALVALALIVLAWIGISAVRRGRALKNLQKGSCEMREILQAIRSELAEKCLRDEEEQDRSIPAPLSLGAVSVPTADQRAGALAMLRNGASPEEVAAVTGISRPDAELLLRVQKFLAAQPALS